EPALARVTNRQYPSLRASYLKEPRSMPARGLTVARISAVAALAVGLISGCSFGPGPSAVPIVGVIEPAAPTRTLAIAFRVEPASVALHALRESGVTDYLT